MVQAAEGVEDDEQGEHPVANPMHHPDVIETILRPATFLPQTARKLMRWKNARIRHKFRFDLHKDDNGQPRYR